MKYQKWHIGTASEQDTALLKEAGYPSLLATVLAAQCTDARVNTVTPELFRRWPGPAELALATQEELESVIRSTGFYHSKARNLLGAASRCTAEKFPGRWRS